jgi:tetratricopeptide (TPR) repeat protein
VAIRGLAARVSLPFVLLFIFATASPCAHAQEDQWEKHMKSGRKAYSDGMKQRYFHAWGNPGPSPQFTKAEEELLAALAQAQSTFPAGDMRIADTMGALASTYMEEAKYDDAEKIGLQAIAIVEAAVKPDDPRLGLGLMHLALVYDEAGDTEKAAPIWARSLAILKGAGPVDKDDIDNLNLHASFLWPFHQNASEQIHQYVFELKGDSGASDADLRPDLEMLAHSQRGTEAEQSYLRLLEIDKKFYAPDDINTRLDREALARLYLEEGKYAASWPLFQENLEILQAKPARDHESSIDRRTDFYQLTNLERSVAQAYAGAGKDAEAEEMYKRIISQEDANTSGSKVLGPMNLSDDLRGFSGVYRHEHRYDEAIETLKRAQAFDEEIVSSKSAEANAAVRNPAIWTWLTQIELAEIYREKGDNATAEPLFKSALDMTQQLTLAPGHPKLARMLDNYATLLRDEGKFEESEALYKRSLEVWSKCIYPQTADAAETLTNYAALLRKLNRRAEAEPLEARATAILAIVAAPTPTPTPAPGTPTAN